ncbi:MAG TPA: FtsQ-type POTRA domain-containing protein [Anaerovoracaceae bacterium]|nr:FtsQ-type POTRA domain-containing protein [Anaerovoracaceae bacterium]
MVKIKRKKRRKKHYLLKFILIVSLGAGMYYFAMSPLFNVHKIVVKNNVFYDKQQIIEISGIKQGRNLFKLPVNEIKDKLMQDSYIKNAKVSRKIPDEVIITVSERHETAAVPYGDEYIVIDSEGMVLRRSETKPAITIFTGMTLTNIEAGTLLQAEESKNLAGSLKLLQSMQEHEIFFKQIKFSGGVVKAYIYDNLVCEGRPENILKSMDDLEDVLYDLYVRGIERGVIKVGGNGYYSFNASVE